MKNNIGCGILYSLLYVSPDNNTWDQDVADLGNGYTIAHVVNVKHPQYSEFRDIGVEMKGGVLVRTWRGKIYVENRKNQGNKGQTEEITLSKNIFFKKGKRYA